MADNFTTNAGSGGDTFAADDIGGVKYARVKVAFGTDGSATDASASDPLPVTGTITAQDGGGSLTVDGTVSAAQSGSWTVTAAHAITGIGDGRKTVTSAGSAEALAASTTCKRVVICAETDNTGTVVVGGSTVVAALGTRRGIPLGPGDVFELEIDNLADVYLDSTVSTDGVTFTYFT